MIYQRITTDDFKTSYEYDISLRKKVAENKFIEGVTTIEDIERVFGKGKEVGIETYTIPRKVTYLGKTFYSDKRFAYTYTVTSKSTYTGMIDYRLWSYFTPAFYFYKGKLKLYYVIDKYYNEIYRTWMLGDLNTYVDEHNYESMCTTQFYNVFVLGYPKANDNYDKECPFFTDPNYFKDPVYNGMRIKGVGIVRCDTKNVCEIKNNLWSNFLDFIYQFLLIKKL